MRVHKSVPYWPSMVNLGDILDIEDLFGLISAEPPEDPNSVVETDIFMMIKPGNERICVLLRSDGLTYKSISQVTALTECQIKNIFSIIRKRLMAKLPERDVKERGKFRDRPKVDDN